MATVLTNTTAKAIGSYVGETKKQIRDGFGVYNYPNKFFRYEGEWKEGKKHGHGRLIMSDGSFYEGSFEDGEMTGHGYKVWSHTKNSYTGQFKRGELCGNGVMVYGNGNKYKGGWQNNKREGYGELNEATGVVYKGSFHQHKRHGEGYQIYSNGDQYEGEWVRGMKQGHGTMKYRDGTIYDGQWRDGTFNGEGSIVHISGMWYDGMWIAGRPAVEAFTLALTGPTVIEVEQGKTFSIEVFCQTVDGEITNDDGRLLQITAGIRQLLNKRLEERQSEHELFSTPFDFEAEPYPLTELPTDCEPTNTGCISARHDPPSPIVESNDKNSQQEPTSQTQNHGKTSSSPPPTAVGHITFSRSDSVRKNSSSTTDAEGIHEGITACSSQGFLFPVVPAVRTVGGRATFDNLYLPASSKSFSLERFEDASDGKGSQGQKSKRGVGTKKGSMQHSATDVADVKEGRRKKDKKDEKSEERKFCKSGDYIIIVKDVTNPPFLGATLQSVYCHVKVTSKQKRAKSKMDKK